MTASASTTSAWHQHFTREELDSLVRIDDAAGWRAVAVNWALIFGSMALVAWSPGVLTVVIALCTIGARQLGLAVVMHEAAHRTLLRDRRWNDWVGNWLAGYPIWSDLKPYRHYHLQHHAHTWTERDPDLGLASKFPITRASMRRKIWRDLSGQTGWKRARAVLKRDLGISSGRVARTDGGWSQLRGVAITNAALLSGLALIGHAELYLLWVGAWFTTYSLVMRIRSIAEHAMPGDAADPMQNSRTTRTRWWERLWLAPNHVNYHLEHHLHMSVPHDKLPRLHRMLREKGVLDGANVTDGYAAVLVRAASASA